MAKGSTSTGSKRTSSKAGSGGAKKPEDSAGWTDGISDALRDASKKASDLAQNPYARSLLAAGLVAAAAALASNKNVRDVTRRNLRTATEAVEVGADNAGKIGVAIVNAATEAVQHLLSLTGAASAAASAAKPAPASEAKSAAAPKPKTAAKPRTAKPAAAKAPAAKTAAPRKAAAKPAAKSAAKPATRSKPAPKATT